MPTRLSKATILVVDDELPLRHLLVRQLRSDGYKVLEAGYGMEALEVARASPDPSLGIQSSSCAPSALITRT